MPPDAVAEDLAARMTGILQGTPGLMRVMRTARDLALPDWLMFSGSLYQPVLNHLTNRPVDYGLKDYDLAYFDATDLSYEAEDVVIKRAAAAFPSPLREMVEVRNQARVHLWFEDHFGEPYSPLSSSAEAVGRFTSPLFAVAARLETDDSLTLIAPFGLEDVFDLRLRPNPTRPSGGFLRTAKAVRKRWPELRIEP